jgi:hypothetical protein
MIIGAKMKLFNMKRKPVKKLEDLRAEYTALSLQNRRNVEARQLEGKIFALKHPNLTALQQNVAAQAGGKKSKTDNPWNALAGIDKRIIGK